MIVNFRLWPFDERLDHGGRQSPSLKSA
jgi:hypothetical protein